MSLTSSIYTIYTSSIHTGMSLTVCSARVFTHERTHSDIPVCILLVVALVCIHMNVHTVTYPYVYYDTYCQWHTSIYTTSSSASVYTHERIRVCHWLVVYILACHWLALLDDIHFMFYSFTHTCLHTHFSMKCSATYCVSMTCTSYY